MFAFTLPGEPQPWQRPKPMRIGKGEKARMVERFQGDYANWRLATIALLSVWWNGRPSVRLPLEVHVVAVLPRPPKRPKYTIAGEPAEHPWPWSRDLEGTGRCPTLAVGDVDNYAKAVLDIMQRTTPAILADDRFVTDLRASKRFAAVGAGPCTEVRAWRT